MADDRTIQWLTKIGCAVLLFQKPQDKYVEDGKEHGPNYEQRQWEEDHLNAALLKFGAKDSKERRKVRILCPRYGSPLNKICVTISFELWWVTKLKGLFTRNVILANVCHYHRYCLALCKW